jgi:glycosyltransferase involved in cell wall biosynthesis
MVRVAVPVRLRGPAQRALTTRTSRRLRVLLLGPYPPPWGGVQTTVVALREYLRRGGIPCAAINLTRHRRPEADGIYYPETALGVVRLLLRLRYEIIHLHIGGDLSTRLVWLALFCSVLPWAKTVLTFHSGGYPTSPQGRRARPRTLRGFALRRFDRLIAVNEQLVDLFRRFGCRANSIRLIPPHAVPVESLQSLSTAEVPQHIEHFAARHRPLLVSVSGLEPEYDVPLQLDALRMVRGQHPEAGLVVVGSGSRAEELHRQVAALAYGGHVLLAGDVPHAATLAIVRRSDVALRTTWYDGDAISVREALWLETPIIATDNGMRPDGVRLVPIADAPALASAIIDELGRRRERRAAGAQRTDEEGQRNLEATLALYRELLA